MMGFKNDLLAPTIKFNEPARFWNVPNHNRILLEDGSSHNLGSPTREMTPTTPANFGLGQLIATL
jgi:hypothetical protein